MGLALHEDHRNMCGLMQLDFKKLFTITLPNQERSFVPVVPLVHSKYHCLLAVTTTVSLDVQDTFNTAPFTLMMFCGMENSVEV